MRPECMQQEAWKYTVWGLIFYTMRPESIHYEAWNFTLWDLKAYSIDFEAWMYTVWCLKVYTVGLECIQYEAWKHTVILSMRPLLLMAVSPCGLIAFASEEFRKETIEELMTDLSKELMREWSKECEWVLYHKELLGSAAEIIFFEDAAVARACSWKNALWLCIVRAERLGADVARRGF